MKDYDVFYIGDEQALHLLAKDGKPLTGDEKKSEDDKFNKEFDKLKKKQAELAADPKKQAKQEEEDEAQLSDFLRAELFTNPRRELFRGQEVIAFDVNGNPDYKPKKRIDSIIQKLSGTMWVDEQAREIVRLEAHFAESVKIGGGLVASARQRLELRFRAGKNQRRGLAAVLRRSALQRAHRLREAEAKFHRPLFATTRNSAPAPLSALPRPTDGRFLLSAYSASLRRIYTSNET